MPKRLKVLAGALVLLAAMAVAAFWLAGRVDTSAPLQSVKAEVLTIRVDQQNRELHVVLEKRGDLWRLNSPIDDQADAGISNDLLSSLQILRIGDVLSKDPASYDDYDLTNKKAVQIQVLTGSSTVFNGYFGKPSASPDSLYFRYADKPDVRLSQGVENFILTRSTEDYRERQLFPPGLGEVSKWSLVWKDQPITLSRSAGQWSSDSPALKPADAASLASSLSSLRVAIFLSPGQIPDKRSGLNAPVLTVTAAGKKGQATWLFGDLQPPTVKGAKSYYRFVQSKERHFPAALSVYDTDPIFDLLNPPKTPAKKR